MADTLTDGELDEILATKSYAEMLEVAAKYGVDLEGSVMDWEVGVDPLGLGLLDEHRKRLRDVEKDGMTLLERERAENIAASAAGETPPNVDTAARDAAEFTAATGQPASSTNPYLQMFQEQAGAGASNGGGVAFLSDADIQAIFRRSGNDLSSIARYEEILGSYRRDVDPNFQDPFSVDMTADGRSARQRLEGSYVPGGMTADQYRAAEGTYRDLQRQMDGSSYTLSQATNLLYGMTPGEIRNLQRKLQRAGYFQTNGDAGDEPLFWGDPTDARTQSAWQNLLGDSIRTGMPVYDMLDRRIQTARESELDTTGDGTGTDGSGRQQPDIVLTDAARIRQNADEMARNTIGRKLSDDENAALVAFIHDLQRNEQTLPPDVQPETAGAYAQLPEGATPPERYLNPESDQPSQQPGVGPREYEAVDVNAQIQEYIRRQNPQEAEGRDVALAYNDFASLLAGPGRGGSF